MVDEFVDRPLIVGVQSVFRCRQPPVRSDQKIRRQPEATSGGLDRSERAALRAAAPECRGQTGGGGSQCRGVEKRLQSAVDAEAPIQLPVRVGNQREGQAGLVLGQLRGGGVKDDDSSMPWERISSWRVTIERR